MRALLLAIFLFPAMVFAVCPLQGEADPVVAALRAFGNTEAEIEDHLGGTRLLMPRFNRLLEAGGLKVSAWLTIDHDSKTAYRTLTGILETGNLKLAKAFIVGALNLRREQGTVTVHAEMEKFMRLFPVWSNAFEKDELRDLLLTYAQSPIPSMPSVLGYSLPAIYKHFAGDWRYLGPILEAMPRGEWVWLLAAIPVEKMPAEYAAFFRKENVDGAAAVTSGSVRTLPGAAANRGCCALSEPTFDQSINSPVSLVAIVYLRLNGVIVGALKNHARSENTVLGLENVRDAEGRLTVVRGGLYSPREEFVQEVLLWGARNPNRHRPHYPLIYDISSLELKPLRMIGVTEGEPDSHYLSRLRWMRRIVRLLSEIAEDLAEAM